MAIIKSKHAGNFTVLPNEIFQSNLSVQAIGLLAYLLSLPHDWLVHKNQLRDKFSIGRDSMNNIIKELETKGYFISVRKHGKGGVFEYDYVVYDIPFNGESQQIQGTQPQTDLPSTADQLTVNRTTVEPHTVKPTPTKETLVLNTNNTKETIIKDIVSHLNLVANKSFSAATKETIKHISGRLNNYSKEDLIAVIDLKVKQWLNDEKFSQYLRPSTLFNESKFENYIQEYRSGVNKAEQPYNGYWEVHTINQNGTFVEIKSNEDYLKLIEHCKNPNRFPKTEITKAIKTIKKF